MVRTSREIAKAWRECPADRARIERQIAVSDMQSLFRWKDGQLLARITPDDRARITASGGGAYRSAADRRFGAFASEIAALAGCDIAPGATLDGECITQAEAEMHREIARRAA